MAESPPDRRIALLRVQAHADLLKVVRARVGGTLRSLGLSEAAAADVVIAVNEACMNIIQHGYGGDPAGEIEVDILNNGRQVEIRLRDRARPVCPEEVHPRDLNDLRPGGLGTHFIRSLMDEFTVTPAPDGRGNLWRMTRTIS
jgi:anti-sigma regulatory factor (Ser/Thr protein kinase)